MNFADLSYSQIYKRIFANYTKKHYICDRLLKFFLTLNYRANEGICPFDVDIVNTSHVSISIFS